MRRLILIVVGLVTLSPLLAGCFGATPLPPLPAGVHRVYYNGGLNFYLCYEPWTGGFPTCPVWV